ncbi:hypothetical protein D3C71_22990 [compost metagenome]
MTTPKPKNQYFYKLFRVRRNDGRVTTVSLDPVLVTQACKTIDGGLREVSKLVRSVALGYEDGMYKSCSGYVRQQLTQAVEVAMAARRSERAAQAAAQREAALA